jgi:hypothetical protein
VLAGGVRRLQVEQRSARGGARGRAGLSRRRRARRPRPGRPGRSRARRARAVRRRLRAGGAGVRRGRGRGGAPRRAWRRGRARRALLAERRGPRRGSAGAGVGERLRVVVVSDHEQKLEAHAAEQGSGGAEEAASFWVARQAVEVAEGDERVAAILDGVLDSGRAGGVGCSAGRRGRANGSLEPSLPRALLLTGGRLGAGFSPATPGRRSLRPVLGTAASRPSSSRTRRSRLTREPNEQWRPVACLELPS